jgi:hypothetical protein
MEYKFTIPLKPITKRIARGLYLPGAADHLSSHPKPTRSMKRNAGHICRI